MKEVSAGALIALTKEKMLYYVVIKSTNGDYGLPKGHVEEGETLQEAALREIKEETGITARLLPGYEKVAEYTMPNGILKEVHYFLAVTKDPEPVPQEGEVEEILILPFIKAYELLTYPITKQVLEEGHRILLEAFRKRQ